MEALGEAEDAIAEVIAVLFDLAGVIKKMLKPMIAFLQVNSSFIKSFPSIRWPKEVLAIFEAMGSINIDFSGVFSGASEAVGGYFNYANTTVIQMTGFLCAWTGLLSMASILGFLFRKNQGKKETFIDKVGFFFVFTTFLMYPSLCQKLLRMYKSRYFGEFEVLEDDWGLEYSSLRSWHDIGYGFFILFVMGIPGFFFVCLYYTARPTERPPMNPVESAAYDKTMARRVKKCEMLYDIYEPQCWWWEITELARKLILTAAVGFLPPPGSTTQISVSAFIAMGFWMLSVKFSPFLDDRLDYLNFTSQMSTCCTLFVVVLTKADITKDGILSEQFLTSVLVLLQMLPPVCGVGIMFFAVHSKVSGQRSHHKKRKNAAYVQIDVPPPHVASMLKRLDKEADKREKAEKRGRESEMKVIAVVADDPQPEVELAKAMLQEEEVKATDEPTARDEEETAVPAVKAADEPPAREDPLMVDATDVEVEVEGR
jgi:hypothetical protein